jgi:hypothetical protein
MNKEELKKKAYVEYDKFIDGLMADLKAQDDAFNETKKWWQKKRQTDLDAARELVARRAFAFVLGYMEGYMCREEENISTCQIIPRRHEKKQSL